MRTSPYKNLKVAKSFKPTDTKVFILPHSTIFKRDYKPSLIVLTI